MTTVVDTVAINIVYEGGLLMVSSIKMKRKLLIHKKTTLFTIKMTQINTLIVTKMAEKAYPLEPHIPL